MTSISGTVQSSSASIFDENKQTGNNDFIKDTNQPDMQREIAIVPSKDPSEAIGAFAQELDPLQHRKLYYFSLVCAPDHLRHSPEVRGRFGYNDLLRL
jgi:hypothetical protein